MPFSHARNLTDGSGGGGGLTFVYPYGATMTVQAPAHPILSSGPISYPLNRPVAGVWERPAQDAVPGGKNGAGRGGGGGRAGGRGAGGGKRAARPEDNDDGGERCFDGMEANDLHVYSRTVL